MKNKINKIILWILSSITIIIFSISTIIVIVDKINNRVEKYVINDNKPYLISNYNKIVNDVKNYTNEDVYLFGASQSISIYNGCVTMFDVFLLNKDITNGYYLHIREGDNYISTMKQYSDYGFSLSIYDYLKICNNLYDFYSQSNLYILGANHIVSYIAPKENEYIYKDGKIELISERITGKFYRFKLQANQDENMIVYYEYEEN